VGDDQPKRYSSDPSIRAKQLHAAGLFGGAEFGRRGGRVRVRRAHERIAQIGQKHAAEIEAALVQALRHGTTGQKLRAAEVVAKLWLAADRDELHEAQPEPATRAELISNLADRLSRPGLASSLLRSELVRRNGALDGTATEPRRPSDRRVGAGACAEESE
jgi:hypothetical protein